MMWNSSLELQTPLNRILYLGTLPLFGDLSPKELAVLAEYAIERHFERGETLLQESTPVPAIHLIIDGTVRVSQKGRSFRVFGPRNAVGVMGLLARRGEAVEARADAGTSTLEISADALFEVFEDHFSIYYHVLRRVCQLVIEERQLIPMDAGYSEGIDEESTPCRTSDLDLVERILVLHRALPFTQGSLSALAELARQLKEMHLSAGTQIWRAGERATSLMLLICGTVSCETPSGQRFRFSSGSGLGTFDAIAETPRWYSAHAQTDIIALNLDTGVLLDLFEDHFSMAVDFLSICAKQALNVFSRRAGTSNNGNPPPSSALSFGLPS